MINGQSMIAIPAFLPIWFTVFSKQPQEMAGDSVWAATPEKLSRFENG
jgi:hypothetical protein